MFDGVQNALSEVETVDGSFIRCSLVRCKFLQVSETEPQFFESNENQSQDKFNVQRSVPLLSQKILLSLPLSDWTTFHWWKVDGETSCGIMEAVVHCYWCGGTEIRHSIINNKCDLMKRNPQHWEVKIPYLFKQKGESIWQEYSVGRECFLLSGQGNRNTGSTITIEDIFILALLFFNG